MKLDPFLQTVSGWRWTYSTIDIRWLLHSTIEKMHLSVGKNQAKYTAIQEMHLSSVKFSVKNIQQSALIQMHTKIRHLYVHRYNTSTNGLWIRISNWVHVTSHVLGGLAGSWQTCTTAPASGGLVGGRHGRHFKSMTSYQKYDWSIDEYLLEEQSCQISPRSDSKRRSIRHFWRASPKQEEEQQQESLIWDQFLVQIVQ